MANEQRADRGIHPAIMALLQFLPDAGRPWADKQQWMAAFVATLAMAYPENDGPLTQPATPTDGTEGT